MISLKAPRNVSKRSFLDSMFLRISRNKAQQLTNSPGERRLGHSNPGLIYRP